MEFLWGTIGKEERTTENMQVEPDIRVTLPYEDLLNGKDDELEAAVKEMLKEVASSNSSRGGEKEHVSVKY